MESQPQNPEFLKIYTHALLAHIPLCLFSHDVANLSSEINHFVFSGIMCNHSSNHAHH